MNIPLFQIKHPYFYKYRGAILLEKKEICNERIGKWKSISLN